MPQGDEIFHGLTVEEHLDSGAFTPESWKNRKQKREEILEIFEPLKKLIHTPVGRLSAGIFITLTNWKIMNFICIPFMILIIFATIRAEILDKKKS